MADNKKIIGLAKKSTANKPAAKKATPKKKTPVGRKRATPTKPKVEPVVAVPPTPAELRAEKAKKKVEEVLDDSIILNGIKPNESENVAEEVVVEEPKGVEWLEEQIQILTETNTHLIAENAALKNNNNGAIENPNGSQNDAMVIQLFNELQENYIGRGLDMNGNPLFQIYPLAFMNRLIKFFPYLADHKRYD